MNWKGTRVVSRFRWSSERSLARLSLIGNIKFNITSQSTSRLMRGNHPTFANTWVRNNRRAILELVSHRVYICPITTAMHLDLHIFIVMFTRRRERELPLIPTLPTPHTSPSFLHQSWERNSEELLTSCASHRTSIL